MKRRVVLFIVCLCNLMACGQTDYYAHFLELLDKEDTVGLRTFIPEWEQKAGVSGDTYAAWHNLLVLEGTIADRRFQHANAHARKVKEYFRKNTQKGYENLIFLLGDGLFCQQFW